MFQGRINKVNRFDFSGKTFYNEFDEAAIDNVKDSQIIFKI